jgi:hypothetical protein
LRREEIPRAGLPQDVHVVSSGAVIAGPMTAGLLGEFGELAGGSSEIMKLIIARAMFDAACRADRGTGLNGETGGARDRPAK